MSAASLRARYMGDAVTTASPQRLLVMLYDRLALDLERAQAALVEGDRQEASGQLLHAQDIVLELRSSLQVDAWEGGPRPPRPSAPARGRGRAGRTASPAPAAATRSRPSRRGSGRGGKRHSSGVLLELRGAGRGSGRGGRGGAGRGGCCEPGDEPFA